MWNTLQFTIRQAIGRTWWIYVCMEYIGGPMRWYEITHEDNTVHVRNDMIVTCLNSFRLNEDVNRQINKNIILFLLTH